MKKKQKLFYSAKFRLSLLILFVSSIIVGLAFFYFSENNQESRQAKKLLQEFSQVTDLDPLIKRASQAQYVLLGEASHGTADYYHWRALISQRLISEHNFKFISLEADWEEISRINLYINHQTDPGVGAQDILRTLTRWPTWMWSNYQFLEFVEWLRDYNADLSVDERVQIYGQDIYGIDNSANQVIELVGQVDAELANKIANHYQCLLKYQSDFFLYSRDLGNQLVNCQPAINEVMTILTDLEDDFKDKQLAWFNLWQNALVVSYGESYYRQVVFSGPQSWNTRVQGMKHLVDNLIIYHGQDAQGIIWAHNTHIGDARATNMIDFNQFNIGQLLREQYGLDKVFLLGLTSARGTVMAALNWGDPGQKFMLLPVKPGSLESWLQDLSSHNFYILFNPEKNMPDILYQNIELRGKGVVYNPVYDYDYYAPSVPTQRFDALMFFHSSSALNPL